MRIFISYARETKATAQRLAAGLTKLRHDPWYDDALTGGQAWWDTILEVIREADALLLLVSRPLLDSEAATAEFSYARQLGKPVIPVSVESLPPEELPPDIAALQIVDYSRGQAEAVFDLVAALMAVRASPLPDPLPAPPVIPLSYLAGLSQKAAAPSLTLDEQFALIARLKAALGRAQDRDYAVGVLRRMQQRPDIFRDADREIESLLGGPEPKVLTAPPPPFVAPAKTGWKCVRLDAPAGQERFLLKRAAEHVVEHVQKGGTETLLVDGEVVKKKVWAFWQKRFTFPLTDAGKTVQVVLDLARDPKNLAVVKGCSMTVDGVVVYDGVA